MAEEALLKLCPLPSLLGEKPQQTCNHAGNTETALKDKGSRMVASLFPGSETGKSQGWSIQEMAGALSHPLENSYAAEQLKAALDDMPITTVDRSYQKEPRGFVTCSVPNPQHCSQQERDSE